LAKNAGSRWRDAGLIPSEPPEHASGHRDRLHRYVRLGTVVGTGRSTATCRVVAGTTTALWAGDRYDGGDGYRPEESSAGAEGAPRRDGWVIGPLAGDRRQRNGCGLPGADVTGGPGGGQNSPLAGVLSRGKERPAAPRLNTWRRAMNTGYRLRPSSGVANNRLAFSFRFAKPSTICAATRSRPVPSRRSSQV
jgi:hypothetical protein